MKGKILGIDTGQDFLAAVVLERSLRGYTISDIFYCCFEDLDPVEDKIEAITASLKKLFKSIDINHINNIGIAIPSSSASFRTLKLPFSSKKKIRQILDLELVQHLPKTDDSYLSDFILQPRGTNEESVSILSASVPVSILKTYVDLLNDLRLRPCVITLQGVAAADYLLKTEKSFNSILYIDLSSSTATLSAAKDKTLILVRSLGKRQSEKELIQVIKQTLMGLSLRTSGNFTPEICRVTSVIPIESSLFQTLSEALGCPVVDAGKSIVPINSTIKDEIFSHNALAAAMAAAETRSAFNFCQGPFKPESLIKTYAGHWLSILLLSILALAGFLTSLFSENAILENRLSQLDYQAEIIFKTSFPDTGKIVDPFMQMQIEVKKAAEATGRHLSGGNNLDTNMIKAIDILQEISINIPETIDLEITRFVLNPGRIVLSGTTQNYHEVDKIKGMIEKSKFFKEVRISSATADKTGKSIMFQFNIDL